MKTPKLRGVLGDADIKELRDRNAARLRKTKAAMGDKYAMHPSNRVQRKSKGSIDLRGRAFITLNGAKCEFGPRL